MIVLHASIAILAVITLIIWLRVDPVISLVLGSLYLGIAGGVGLNGTVTAIAEGFGEIMIEVGLLIGFGVLLGALLYAMGALQKFVELLLRVLGPRRLPYTLAAALTTLFPSIYVDVQLVLASPLARSSAPHLGRNGLGMMGGALTAGILVGYVFVVPGLGTVSIAGLLDIPLGTMLMFGLLVGPLTAVLTVFIYGMLLRRGFWNPDKDEAEADELRAEEALAPGGVRTGGGSGGAEPSTGGTATGHTPAGGTASGSTATATERKAPPLGVSLLPVLVPLVLIAFGAIAETAGFSNRVIAFFGNPVLALFLGMVGAYLLARGTVGREHTAEALEKGFDTTGQILLITGVGGSLGTVIGETNLDDVLGGLFTAQAGMAVVAAVLLSWLVAALLHLAIGSISVAAIAASGIIAPVLGGLDVEPVIIGLAIGAGALFALQVNSNFFWMFQTLLGVTTRGALKALTFVTALASVIALPMILLLSVFV
jgi:gluconate:H+ symporter, GntP family